MHWFPKTKLGKTSFWVSICAIFLVLFFAVGCQKTQMRTNEPISTDENVNAPSGSSAESFVYIKNPERSEHNTFSIVKPKDWTEIQRNNTIIYLPPESNLTDPFSEKIAMSVVFLSQNETRSLGQLTGLDIEKSKEILPDLQVIQQDENARLGQIDAIKIIFTGRVQNRTLQITQFRAMQDKKFYALTQQCEQDQCNNTDIFNEMVQSFRWKNPQ